MQKDHNIDMYKFVNLNNSYIEVNNNLYQITCQDQFFDFLETEDYTFLYNKALEKLSKKRNFDIDIDDFFIDLGYDFKNIRTYELLIPFSKLLFLKFLADIEREVGDIILSDFKSYEDVLNFQNVFKSIQDKYFDTGLANFTPQQFEGSKRVKEKFDQVLSSFTNYLKMLAKNKK